MPVVKLNPNFIAQELKCPEGTSRIEFCCDTLKGFYAECRATSPGEATYYLRYKDDAGKTCHQRIGRTNDTALEDARKQAKLLKCVFW